MTETRHRFVGDALVFEFAMLIGGMPAPLPTAVLEFGAFAPDGTTIAGTAAWLDAPDDHVVQCAIPEGATTQAGRHDLQLRITDPSRVEPVRGRVFVTLCKSAV